MNVGTLIVGWLGAITLAAQPAAAQQPPKPNRPPQVWAIVIGIDNYNDPRITDSDTAADSALRVLLWFRAAGWEDDHQLLMRDFGSADPGTPTPPPRTSCPPGTT